MDYQHRFLHSQIARSGFAFPLLVFTWLGCSNPALAQDDMLGVSPTPEVELAAEANLIARVATLPSAPAPKVEAAASAITKLQKQTPASAERTRPFYWLDRKSLVFGLVHGGAEVFDGVTKRYFIHHCSLCFENDPMSRLLLGTHPSWGKMIPMGIGEAALSTYSYQRLSHSPNRLLRGAAPLVPIGLTAVHVIEGARNITLKNNYRCADPGYIVVGAMCVEAPAPNLTDATGTSDGGLGSHHNSL
jgi:hypothetical protein